MAQIVKAGLNGNLIDTLGNLTGGALSRVSAATYVDPEGVLQDSWGDRDQVMNTSAQEDLTHAYWTKQTPADIIAAGSITASAADTFHFLYAGAAGMTANGTFIYSLKAKAGAVGWIGLNIRDDVGSSIGYFNLGTGAWGTVGGTILTYGNDPVDADGYYRIWMVKSLGTITTHDKVYVYAAEADGDNSFLGDGSSISIYVKEIMLEELPSDNTISAELMVDGDCSTDSFNVNDGAITHDAGNEEYDVNDPANGSSMRQDVGAVNGQYYLVSYEVKNYVQGSSRIGGMSGDWSPYSSAGDGVYTYIVQVAAANVNIGIMFSGDFIGSIDNVSAKQLSDLTLLEPSDYVNAATISAKPRFETEGLLLEGEATNLLCLILKTSPNGQTPTLPIHSLSVVLMEARTTPPP
jgi:hypothetical protein